MFGNKSEVMITPEILAGGVAEGIFRKYDCVVIYIHTVEKIDNGWSPQSKNPGALMLVGIMDKSNYMEMETELLTRDVTDRVYYRDAPFSSRFAAVTIATSDNWL